MLESQAAKPFEKSRINIAGSRRAQKRAQRGSHSAQSRCDELLKQSKIVSRAGVPAAVQGATGIPHAASGIRRRCPASCAVMAACQEFANRMVDLHCHILPGI